jgi:hypothetical protein
MFRTREIDTLGNALHTTVENPTFSKRKQETYQTRVNIGSKPRFGVFTKSSRLINLLGLGIMDILLSVILEVYSGPILLSVAFGMALKKPWPAKVLALLPGIIGALTFLYYLHASYQRHCYALARCYPSAMHNDAGSLPTAMPFWQYHIPYLLACITIIVVPALVSKALGGKPE